MNRKQLITALLISGSPATVFAAEYGTAAEAKAMLEKVVAEIKKDKAGALAKFNKGEGGFKDRDLYPFCAGPDGNMTAHPAYYPKLYPKLEGRNLKAVKDKADKPFGEEMYKTAQEGKISELSYMWPRPGGTDPVQKVSFYTKVGDQVCAVGYYK